MKRIIVLCGAALAAVCSPVGAATLGEALNATNLTWTTGGNAAWVAQSTTTHDGLWAVQSGTISHNQQTWIETTVIGPRPLSFWWKVSSELGYDYLEFLTNGMRAALISGVVDWQEQNHSLGTGAQVLRWRYVKDNIENFGQDRGWVDQVNSPYIPATRFVWTNSPSPASPYTSWTTAARTIQTAVDAAQAGDTVIVTNGVYITGSKTVYGSMGNRVAINKAITVQSVNGPGVTWIVGVGAGGGANNGNGAIRCAYMGTNAILSGFTLTNGHTRTSGDSWKEQSGGGVWCEDSAVLTNCTLTGNSAAQDGGGSSLGTLYNCTLTGNSAQWGGGSYVGTLYNCTLSDNYASASGGGQWRGTLNNCTLSGNSSSSGGGGTTDCTLNNCALSGNWAFYDGGGAYGGTLNNCTVTENRSEHSGGGSYDSTLNNCIVYYNTAPDGSNYYGGIFSYSCSTPQPPGTGNISAEPMFMIPSTGDFQLVPNSPCIDAGNDSVVQPGWVDLHGNPRIGGAHVDMGAYEFMGTFPPATLYVWTDSPSPAWPYTNWATAARAIQTAVDAAQSGYTVLVTNGIYNTGGKAMYGTMTNRVAIDKAITVQSVNGPGVTWIVGAGAGGGTTNGDGAIRCAYVCNNAILSGFTLTNGGGGVWCEVSAVVTNCTLSGNSGRGSYSGTLNNCTLSGNSGGGSYSGTLNNCTLSGNSASDGGGSCYGTLNNCTLIGNSVTTRDSRGGGSYESTLNNCTLIGNSARSFEYSQGGGSYGGTLSKCILTGNSVSSHNDYYTSYSEGGGSYGGTLNNCTLTGNSAIGYIGQFGSPNGYGDGGGSYESTLNNCTLSDNSAWSGGGVSGGMMTNCIVYYNTASSGSNYSGGTFSYSCATPIPSGMGNICADPLFVNVSGGDLRLMPSSPCIDAGSDSIVQSGWVDLDGYPRIMGAHVDMGAYEFMRTPTIVENPQSVTKLSGATATFSVTVTGTLPLSFQWRCNGTNLADGNRISDARTSSLTITNVQSQDAGFYTAVVINPWGSVTSAPALLRVLSVEHLTLSVSNQSPASFDFTNAAWVEVTLTAPFPNPFIWYTLDGSPPSPSSTEYTGTFIVSNTVVLRALAINPVDFTSVEMAPSAVNLWTAFHLVATATAGGTVAFAPPGGFYLSNTVVTLTALPEPGWECLNWTGDASGTSSNINVVMDRDKLVTAQFGLIPRYTLAVTTAGGGAVSGNTQSDYLRGTTVNLSAAPAAGWEFLSWSGDASGTSSNVSLVMDRNKSVTAQFSLIPRFTVAVTVTGGGAVSGNTQSDYLRGTTVNLSAEPASGWEFLSWIGDASSTSSNIGLLMDMNKSVTAQFRQFLFTLTVTTVGGGAVSGNTQSNYFRGTTVNLSAEPTPGWYFQSWSGDTSGTSRNLSVVMDWDKSVVARFPPLTLLAVTAGGGTITANPASNYVQDSTVKLTAQPQSGWTFLNWMSDASGTNPQASVTMDRPKEVQAVFGTEYKTTVLGQGMVVRNFGTGLVPFGAVVRLTAIPQPGYYLGLWGNAASSQVNPLDFTVTNANPTVGAFFLTLGANQATLTVLEQGAGGVSSEPQANAYTKNQVVRLTAQPFPGQSFLGWAGDASGTQNPLAVTVTTNQTITANFARRLGLAIQPWPGPTQHRGFLFLLAGDEGITCLVQTSPDLADWQPLTTLTISNTAAQFIDVAVTNHSPRFYRALSQP